MKKKSIIFGIAAVVAIAAISVFGFNTVKTKHNEPVIHLNDATYSDLSKAIEDASVDSTLYVSGNIDVSKTIAINKNITISPDSKADHVTITASELTSPLFNVSNGSAITIQGTKDKNIDVKSENKNTVLINADTNAVVRLNEYVNLDTFKKDDGEYVIAVNKENNQELMLGKYTDKDVYKSENSSDAELTLEKLGKTDQECIVGDTVYHDLSEAVKNANDGDTITLKSDIYLDSTIVIDKNIEITGDYDIYMIGSVANTTFLVQNDCSLKLKQTDFYIHGSNCGAAIICNNSTVEFNNLHVDDDYTFGVITTDANKVMGKNTRFVESPNEETEEGTVKIFQN